MLRLRAALSKLEEQALSGGQQRLLFLVPPNNRCSGPLYEIVMMTLLESPEELVKTMARKN
jgi:sulfide:quinone oxidoreductase